MSTSSCKVKWTGTPYTKTVKNLWFRSEGYRDETAKINRAFIGHLELPDWAKGTNQSASFSCPTGFFQLSDFGCCPESNLVAVSI
jgi:hypothetical protein